MNEDVTEQLPAEKDKLVDSWTAKFRVLQERFNAGGDVNAPINAESGGLMIGVWCQNQRAAHKSGRLSAERIAQLKAIGFDMNPHDKAWEGNFSILAARHKAKLEVNVAKDVVIDGLAIGRWCQTQRANHAAGKLSAERIAKLESIGFILDPLGDAWNANYRILMSRYTAGHDVNLAQKDEIDGLKIGSWLSRQKRAHKAGTLQTERIAKLEGIGLRWSAR